MTNYFDKQGNYINCENLSLAEIYHRAFALGVESVAIDKKPQGELVRKEDILHYIATQYSEHNELVPIWLRIGDLEGGRVVPDTLQGWRYEERPQELTEINHRLNLLIGVLYTNQLISESDLNYIEDSIKKLMKGGAE